MTRQPDTITHISDDGFGTQCYRHGLRSISDRTLPNDGIVFTTNYKVSLRIYYGGSRSENLQRRSIL